MTVEWLPSGNHVRWQRAQFKRRIRDAATRSDHAGWLELAAIIAERPPSLRTARLWDVLGWAPYEAGVRRRIFAHVGVISEFRTIGELTDRQIALLVQAIRSPVTRGVA